MFMFYSRFKVYVLYSHREGNRNGREELELNNGTLKTKNDSERKW